MHVRERSRSRQQVASSLLFLAAAFWLSPTLTPHALAQQGAAVVRGRIADAASQKPIADAVVTLTSPDLQAEEIAVTDASGVYRVQNLPPGRYALQVEAENYQPYAHEGLDLHADNTIQLDVLLLPTMLQAEEIVVIGKTPTIDVGGMMCR